ncbi:MAG: hypothetical protein IKU81_07105 [Oscillibacter sp.]|jgi:uncharacterized membrane protein|nr:hypothetical protein [Oscillibacter sp.]
MDKKTTGIVAYITWIGLLIAFIAGDKEGAKFHLNQALVVWIAGLICGFIPLIGWIGSLFCLVCAIIGLISAINGTEKEVPLLGKIKLLK